MGIESAPGITEWVNNLGDIFAGKSFSLPIGHTILILLSATACLLWGKFKLGFFLSYTFIIYWMIAANKAFFMTLVAGNPVALVIYAFSGMALTLLIFYGFFQESH